VCTDKVAQSVAYHSVQYGTRYTIYAVLLRFTRSAYGYSERGTAAVVGRLACLAHMDEFRRREWVLGNEKYKNKPRTSLSLRACLHQQTQCQQSAWPVRSESGEKE
jgi:hypothetical protein